MNVRVKNLAITVALTALAPLAAQAQVANGLYEAPVCQNPQSSSIVRVSAAALSFFESSCSISNARAVPGVANAYTYDAYCTGEGEQADYWTTYTIQAIHNGLVLTHAGGTGFSYAYCGQ